MKKYVIPVIIPYVEQKKDWIFDNQKIEKDTQKLNKDSLEELIKKHLDKIEEASEQYYVEVAFTGADFTSLSEQEQEEFLELIQKYIRMERVDSIRVSIRPNNITKQKLKMLKKIQS